MAQLWPTVDARTLVVNVDRALYVVWAVVYAGLGTLLCHWLSQFTTPHIIADQLPWRGLYNTLFSDGLLLIVVLLAVVWWLRHDRCGQMRQGFAMLLPVVAILVLSVGFEMGENMRYKFFLEPVLYVFLLAQLHSVWRAIHRTRSQTPVSAEQA